ncbi:hypothetical protein Acr_04g0003570 [Actinidia rufa]|uniref:RRM domain-containing protein n=1 Tax=Actinidia rufa TaxID=165716 RepID=A0A7J0EI96_9ERIC|nr:hypothetical protein Acr_04g0003570 [Actinidia rufa]
MSPNFNPNARYDVQKEAWNPSSRTEQGKQDRGRGGWTPVINKHARKKMNISGDEEVITLFNNLPNPVDKNWLMKTFSKFGKIRDVFIPLKRNISGNRFGFLRFECPIAANRAIRTLNGTWSYDKQLGVKIAGYSRNINHSSRSNAGVCPTVGEWEKLVSIKGKTDGVGWLSRSAVGKLNVLVDNAKHQSTSEKQKQGIGFIESASTTNEEAEESQHKLKKGLRVFLWIQILRFKVGLVKQQRPQVLGSVGVELETALVFVESLTSCGCFDYRVGLPL